MRQLVGRICVICGRTVCDPSEARFCARCHCPVHRDCMGSAHAANPTGGCPACGATPEDRDREKEVLSVELRSELAAADLREAPMSAWTFCAGFLVIGTILLLLAAFDLLFGITAEDNLTLAEGLPAQVVVRAERPHGGKSDYLSFTIAGFQTTYSSDHPKYPAILAAVRSGKPLRAWVSTKRETIFRFSDAVPLYKLSVGQEHVLTYADASRHKHEQLWVVLLCGGCMTGAGAWATRYCWRYYRRPTALRRLPG